MQFLQLTNYWWLVIWIFGAGLVFSQMNVKSPEKVLGKTEYRWRWGPAILLVFPYVIWAGNRTIYMGDTAAYIRTYNELPGSIFEIASYLVDVTKDKGFTVLSIIIKAFTGDSPYMYFMIIAVFQMLCMVIVFRKYSCNYWISIFLFILSTDYISWMMNGMRQFIAVTMIFAAFELMVKKKYIPLICVILLASTIHGSALLMLPIVFIVQGDAWNMKTLLVILAAMLIIVYIDQFTPLLDTLLADTQYSDMVTNEIWTNDDGVNVLRVLVYSVPALLSFLGRKYVRAVHNPVVNICVNCSVITMALYLVAMVSSGIYVGRLPIYTTLMGYMSLPWLIDHMFTRESANMVKFLMIGAYLVFFYIQMFVTWG